MTQPEPTGGQEGSPAGQAAERDGSFRRFLPFAVVAAAVAAAGLPLGLLWAWLAPDTPVRVAQDGLRYAEPQPEQVAAADVWFALLGLAAGVVVAVAAWVLVPRLRGPGALVAVVVGLVGAGLVAWWLGRQVGLAGYEAALAQAEPGTLLGRPPDLRVAGARWWPPGVGGVPLAPAMSAAITYTLLAAWSRYPALRADGEPLRGNGAGGERPDPEPGRGPERA
jgi:hypothetical protein